MAVTPRLELKPAQSLLMTPQLRQAISLLQMSNLELQEVVAQELENNPLLEREDDTLSQTEIPLNEINAAGEDAPAPGPETEESEYLENDDYGSDREGYDGETDYDWEDYTQSKKHSSDEDFNYFEKKLRGTESLYEFLQKQITLAFPGAVSRAIAYSLMEHLDDAGYFRGNVPEIAKKLNVSKESTAKILQEMKKFEPTGIFAENLTECLSLQLKEQNKLDPMMENFLANLELLAAGKIKELKKICRASDEDIASIMADIKQLNPKPAAKFEHDIISYVIPDVFVRTNKYGEYIIELNQMSLPRVLINREYYLEISRFSKQDKEAKRYLKEKIGSANFLIRALQQRATTILRVSEEIVKRKRSFFEEGIEHLKPMGIKDIAEALEMHESTISRVTNNKYMHTPRGIFELKYFFTNAAGSYIGNEDTSTASIKYKIKKLITEESAENILSDDKLAEILAESGVKIARRTVAKYRESMGIPSSSERKRNKKSAIR